MMFTWDVDVLSENYFSNLSIKNCKDLGDLDLKITLF